MKNHTWLYTCCCFLLLTNHLSGDMSLISLRDLMHIRSGISYLKCYDRAFYKYQKLPVPNMPTNYECMTKKGFRPVEGVFEETFVVTIPHGIVCAEMGCIRVDNFLVKDFFLQNQPFDFQWNRLQSFKLDEKPVKKISGKVAILAHPLSSIFGHWFTNVMSRLIVLQKSGIEYDWLYAPKKAAYMRTTYELFGIPLDKIIDSSGGDEYIQADELIVPSFVTNRLPCMTDPVYDCWAAVDFHRSWVLDEVRLKFLPVIKQQIANGNCPFGKRVFVSRKDTSIRQMINEDEIFNLFQPFGFERYCLSQMSLLEQATLFYNADYIVAAHGSGLANILFCKSNTKIIEIFQGLYDAMFYNLAQDLSCPYHCIHTAKQGSVKYCMESTVVPASLIRNFIESTLLPEMLSQA